MHILMLTSEWRPDIERQVESLQKAGVLVDLFQFRGAKNPVNYLKAWFRVQKKIINNTYDLVHAQWGQSGVLALPKKLPLVITYRGSDLKGIVNNNGNYTFSGCILKWISKITALLSDEVIVMSEQLAHHLPKRSFQIIPSGLDLELFKPMDREEARRKLGMPVDKQFVLFVTSYEDPVKRYELAQASVARLNHNLKVELLVANQVPYSQMPVYMNACDALLLTSLHEGSPNAVKEALACNLPVVSVDVGDVRERIQSIEGCIVCEDDEIETIAAGLRRTLERNKRISGRESILALDEEILTERVISVYHDAATTGKQMTVNSFRQL